MPALFQALALLRHLRAFAAGRPDPVGAVYLGSDLVFLKELFSHFSFSYRTEIVLERFLAQAGPRSKRT